MTCLINSVNWPQSTTRRPRASRENCCRLIKLYQARQAYYATSDAAIAIYNEQKNVLQKIDLGTDDALVAAREQLDALQQQTA